jgi:hypothetical protein
LAAADSERDPVGDVFLADLGIPPTVFERAGIEYDPVFGGSWWVRGRRTT